MEYFAVTGGRPLAGEVRVHGAKNSALPILAATLLVRGESVIHNCPDLTDIQTALDILSCLGCRVRRTGETVTVDAAHLTGAAIPDELMGRMRASVLFLGALLARQGEASAWLVDANGKLLEAADDTMKQEYPNVTGLELLEPKQGKQAATTDENQSKLKGLVALTQALSDCGLMEGVTSIDVSSGTEIQVVYQGRLTIKLLNNANFEKKMQPLRTVIAVAGDNGKGIINMKGTDKVIWTKQN